MDQYYQERPRRVKPVRWQIKDCLTTEPRTFDSWLLVVVHLIYPLSTVHLRTYLLPSIGLFDLS